MRLEEKISKAVANAVKRCLAKQSKQIKFSFNKPKEFEGDITVVTFPFVKLARKSPEETGRRHWRMAAE